jgi:hypothetical protein
MNNIIINKPTEKDLMRQAITRLHMGVVMIMASGMWSPSRKRKNEGIARAPIIKRHRINMENVFYELGPRNARQAYRMSVKLFCILCDLLKSKIIY